MTSGTLTPAIFGVSAHVASKLRKTNLFICIFCIFKNPPFFSKKLGAETNEPGSIDFKRPDMTGTSRDFGPLCLALVYTESHKARKHDVASA